MQRPLKIGTRGSPLALYQARLVQGLLASHWNIDEADKDAVFPVCIYKTSGDRLKGKLSDFGGKGLFTKELEEALSSGDIDLAVHSMKDVPTTQQDGLEIGAVLEREDPRDAFISLTANSIDALPHGALVGTASLRRRAQLSHQRPDIRFSLLRGNVGTRLEKLGNGDCDATFLAVAGLVRLENTQVITEYVGSELMLNAPAQGAIGIECRRHDAVTMTAIRPLNHEPTEKSIIAERSFLKKLDGSCRTPIAALVEISGNVTRFRGEVLASDGSEKFSRDTKVIVSSIEDYKALGHEMGAEIKAEIGDRDLWHD